MHSISETNIPKVIHYCWFGPDPFSQDIKDCLASWKKYMPDYKIIEWNAKNFDVNICNYARQAYDTGKYAFVSDYARLHILYNYGGIYMDCDVEILKPLDPLLANEAFTGFETRNLVAAWIMASIKGQTMIKQFLDLYAERSFIKENGQFDMTPNTNNITDICNRYGLITNDEKQTIEGLTIYPMTYFCPWKPNEKKHDFSEDTYSIHHFAGSWLSDKQKRMRQSYLWKIAHVLVKIALRLLGTKRYMKLKEMMRI